MDAHAVLSVLVLIAALRCANGIIPGPCVNASRNAIMEVCCPSPNASAGPCGSNLDSPRGQCVNVSDINSQCQRDPSESDPRKDWPHFFTHLCKCEGNFYGYDCGECKFGYRGESCTEPVTRKRKSMSALSAAERQSYVDALKTAKHEDYSRYMAISSDDPLEIVQVTLYDLFTWVHYYAGRENNDIGNPDITAFDFAHESGGFPTWHRMYLLWFEREVQILTGNDDFTVPYWEWTVENDRNVPLSDDWFGRIDSSEEGAVTGYFGSAETWPLVCSGAGSKPPLCDPSSHTAEKLRRCPSVAECDKSDERWPSPEDIAIAIGMYEYDTEPYNRTSQSGFRNYMEGFDNNGCSDDQPLCSGGIQRKLHNTVHLILGIGDFKNIDNITYPGTMGDVPIAANDPVFINHHSMIDYIFEQWLQEEYNAPYGPPDTADSKYIGHREHDCLVPFIPLYANADFYKQASEFGYEYEESQSDDRSAAVQGGPSAGGLAAAVLACTLAGLI